MGLRVLPALTDFLISLAAALVLARQALRWFSMASRRIVSSVARRWLSSWPLTTCHGAASVCVAFRAFAAVGTNTP
jgi:hypothetical protein